VKSEKEKMIAGELYNPQDPELVAERLRARSLMAQINSSTDPLRREELMRALFAKTGEKFLFEPPFYCDYGYNISIGERVYANVGCVFLDGTRIVIGNDVLFAPYVQLYTATHPLDWRLRDRGLEIAEPITIGNHVWLGGNTVVCPGVTIGDHSVIGAGSVVTKDIPPGVLAVGNPARVIREIDPQKE